MHEKIVSGWQKPTLLLMVAAGTVVGIGLIVVATYGWFGHPFDEIARDIGLAFLVSVIIGTSYEWFIRKRLLEDTLKVALGYILPDELKPEVRSLYEIPYVCTRHRQTMQLKPSGNSELVILHMKVERTLKNITNRKQPLSCSTSVREWFFEGLSSSITTIEAVQEGTRWSQFKLEKSPGCKRGNKLVGTLEQSIEVQPGKSLTVLY